MEALEHERPWWLLAPARMSGIWWLGFAALLLAAEYITGLYNQFPLVYVIPVSLAAYYSGRWPALMIALISPLAHIAFELTGPGPVNVLAIVSMAAFRASI